MIEIIPFEESNVVGLRLDGKMDDESYHQAIAAIDNALENNNKTRIYAEVIKIGGMSLETFIENVKIKFQYFKELDKFEKEAIVSDKSWLETWIKIGDKLFPSVEVRYFPTEEKEAALAWVKK